MYSNESLLINSTAHVQMNSYSCRDQISTWLWVHFVFTWRVYLGDILLPCMTIFTIGWLTWLVYECCSRRSSQSFTGIDDEREGGTLFDKRFRQLKRYFTFETKLICSYILASWTFELTRGTSIRWMSIARWIIEGTFFPMVILSAMFESHFRLGPEYLLYHNPRVLYMFIYPTKMILFFVMRYIDIYPQSKLNDERILLFNVICNNTLSHVNWSISV